MYKEFLVLSLFSLVAVAELPAPPPMEEPTVVTMEAPELPPAEPSPVAMEVPEPLPVESTPIAVAVPIADVLPQLKMPEQPPLPEAPAPPAQVDEVVAEVPAGGQTAHITAHGTVMTVMPCSWTGTLRERYFTIAVSAQISYVNEEGELAVHPYQATRTFEQPAGGDGGFRFTFNVTIPGASRIIGITANVMVNIFTAYGIHGWFTFQYGGRGTSASDTLSVQTNRWGQENTVPGATTLCGLLPDFETKGEQPGGGVLPLPNPILVQPTDNIGPGGYCNCEVNCIGHWNATNVQVRGVSSEDCNHENPAMAQAEQISCQQHGVGSRRECHYEAPIQRIDPPTEHRSHCVCRFRCGYSVGESSATLYGFGQDQCHFGSDSVDTAVRQMCQWRGMGSEYGCEWIE